MSKKGDRVGAILGAEKGMVEFLGYGVYDGDHVPTEGVGPFADMMKKANIPNPKIILDSGRVVYGCECWWGPEEEIRKKVAAYEKVVIVDIDALRKSYNETP